LAREDHKTAAVECPHDGAVALQRWRRIDILERERIAALSREFRRRNDDGVGARTPNLNKVRFSRTGRAIERRSPYRPVGPAVDEAHRLLVAGRDNKVAAIASGAYFERQDQLFGHNKTHAMR